MKTYKEQENGSLQLGLTNYPVVQIVDGEEVDSSFKIKIDAEVLAGESEITAFDRTAYDTTKAARIIIDNAKKHLAETDWYVIRKYERDVAIPQTIIDSRAQAVTDANEA